MSALGDLYDSVASSFADAGGLAQVLFGELEVARQDNQGLQCASRIVFVPCDGDSVGDMLPGQEGAIYELRIGAALYVWAYDPDEPESERAQYEATRTLFAQLTQYLFALSAGTIRFGKVARVKRSERMLGSEWRVSITLRDDLEYARYTSTTDDLIPAPRFSFASAL